MPDIGDFLREFKLWLRDLKGVAKHHGARKKRDAVTETAANILYPIVKENRGALYDMLKLLDTLKGISQTYTGEKKKHLNYLIDFVNEKTSVPLIAEEGLVSQEGSQASEVSVVTPAEIAGPEIRKTIGRVSITKYSPSTPTEFIFWVEDREDLHLESMSIITTVGRVQDKDVKITGIVEEVKAISAADSPMDDFYATGYGDPTLEVPTKRPIIKTGKVNIVRRSDGRFEPLIGGWPVYFSTAEEIMDAYGADITEERSVLAGFTWDENRNPVPIFLDSDYLLGYESAHANIAGASGLATKTSYALFLLQSILSYADRQGESIAAIAFNVKEADLMRIDEGPDNWENLEKTMIETDDPFAERHKILWEASKAEGLDPFDLHHRLMFFAPPRPRDPSRPLTFRRGEVSLYSYGLMDLLRAGRGALLGLLEPEDIDERTSALLYAVRDTILDPTDQTLDPRPNTLVELIARLQQLARGREQWVQIGPGGHHTATINKVVNRLTAIRHQLQGLLLQTDGLGNPVPVENIQSGQLWIVDISKLHPKGQRLVFHSVYQTLGRLLEARRNNEDTVRLGDREIRLETFPQRVVVFVDELNKFAPRGREYSPLRSQIVDITARGRSFGLSLLGAEQLAAQVDDEILANTSTFIVGRSHSIGMRGAVYDWLQGGLKDRVFVLRKGDMMMWHAVHTRPVLISFPKPLHTFVGE